MAMRCLVLAVVLSGCAELGVVSDGTSISVGKPSHGYLIQGARLPDHGEGFTTREVWRARDNRYGTDELVDLVVGVARRLHQQVPGVALVIADLSGRGGGERYAFHRSHQSGRDADFLYYMRDASGQPFEPDAMHVFDAAGRAHDGSGLTVDIPRTWLLIKELITAPEAPVQWIFMYEPLARRLLDHAARTGEPEVLIARARMALKQPGDSARHDDHLHVRVYCSPADRAYGCIDIGPMEMLAERQAEQPPIRELMGALTAPPASSPPSPAASDDDLAAEGMASGAGAGFSSVARTGVWAPTAPLGSTSAAATGLAAPASLGRLLRARVDHLSLRGWR